MLLSGLVKRGGSQVPRMRFMVCLLCLGLAGQVRSGCLTSLPMPLLEECIVSESEGRSYPARARLKAWNAGNAQVVLPGPSVLKDRDTSALSQVAAEIPLPIGAVPAREGAH
jgi:hypothetical protein